MFEKIRNPIAGRESEEKTRIQEEVISQLNNPDLEKISDTFLRNANRFQEETMMNESNEPSSEMGKMSQTILQNIYKEQEIPLALYIVKNELLLEERGLSNEGAFNRARQFLFTDENFDKIVSQLDLSAIRLLLKGIHGDFAYFLKNRFYHEKDTFKEKNSDMLKRYYRARQNLTLLLPYLDIETRQLNEELLRSCDIDNPDFSELTEAEWNKRKLLLDMDANNGIVRIIKRA